MQISRELGMLLTMFNLNTNGPEDECFMAGMRDLVLQCTSSASFGSLMAILTPYVGPRMNDVTTMVVSLGKAESQWQQKSLDGVSSPLCLSSKKQPCVGDQHPDVGGSFRGWSRSK